MCGCECLCVAGLRRAPSPVTLKASGALDLSGLSISAFARYATSLRVYARVCRSMHRCKKARRAGETAKAAAKANMAGKTQWPESVPGAANRGVCWTTQAMLEGGRVGSALARLGRIPVEVTTVLGPTRMIVSFRLDAINGIN